MSTAVKRIVFSEFTFWLVLAGIGVYFLLPLREKLRLGIDLVGGTFLTLEVQVDKAVEAALIERRQAIKEKLERAQKEQPVSEEITSSSLIMNFENINDAQDAANIIRAEMPDVELDVRGMVATVSFSERRIKEIKKDAVERNIEVLRTRVNKLGVADIPIAAQGEKNIVIELPDVSDPQQAKAMIGKAAQLEFRLVDKYFATREDMEYELDDVPSNKELLAERNGRGFYLVQKYAEVTGKDLKEAHKSLGGQNGVDPVVAFEFTDDGGRKFYDLTSKNVGHALAIILDGVVISAPRINEGIRNQGIISGNFTTQETGDLALLLKSGSFVAPVSFEEERQIGPSLGAESIRQGITACLVGLALLFVFSILYYRTIGLFAFLALIFNLILVLVGMEWLGATLTLPGIAGMVLTVGMAIDASILIFERVKEVLAQGETSLKKAVDIGFSDAMWVILDANFTTLIVGIVLYYFGTGPIKGFAVTMILGILATLVASLRFMRSLFNLMFRNFKIQNLKF